MCLSGKRDKGRCRFLCDGLKLSVEGVGGGGFHADGRGRVRGWVEDRVLCGVVACMSHSCSHARKGENTPLVIQ